MKGIKIFLADGFEDVEALATYDVLRRAGIKVELVSITGSLDVCSSHGVCVKANALLSQIDWNSADTGDRDYMIFPGGMPGSKSLATCPELISEMKRHYALGGSLAAICAAPGLVLSQLDDWKGREFTCFEGFQDALIAKGGQYLPDSPAVRDGRIVTGRSAGHAISFAFCILEGLVDEQTREEVYHAMYLY